MGAVRGDDWGRAVTMQSVAKRSDGSDDSTAAGAVLLAFSAVSASAAYAWVRSVTAVGSLPLPVALASPAVSAGRPPH